MPLNLGLVGAGGAKGASDALQEILKRRFLEQAQADQVANEQQQRAIEQERNALYDRNAASEASDRAATRTFTETKFKTEQDAKETRRMRLRGYIGDEKNPQALRDLAAAQLAEIEGLGSVGDMYGPQGRALSQDDVLRENFAKHLGYTSAAQMTHEDDNAFLNWKTNATTRPQFVTTAGGIMAGSPGQGPAPTVAPVTAPPPTAGPGPKLPTVQPMPPSIVAQGGEGLVSVTPRAGTSTPVISTKTGQQEQLPPAVVTTPTGPGTLNKGASTFRAITSAATGDPIGKAASPGAAARIAVYDDVLDDLRDMIALKNDAWIGPVAGRETQAKLATGVALDERLAAFAAKNAHLKNAIINAVTGKQLSKDEGDRILAEVPDLTNPSAAWNQRAAGALQSVMRKRKSELDLGGITTGGNVAKRMTETELQAMAKEMQKPVEEIRAAMIAKGYTIR